MKIADIINQLRAFLPKYTGLFSNIINPTGAVATATETSFTFSEPHNLSVGQSVTISGANVETAISSFTKDGLVYTFETDAPHDLTEVYNADVTFSGFSDADWNATFNLLNVPNRTTFRIQSSLSAPTLQGSEKLLENRNDGINGRYRVADVPLDTEFKIEGTFLEGAYTNVSVNIGVRISGAVEIERGIEQYTQQEQNDYWLFVVPHPAVVSKDRNALSDATATKTASDSIRLRLIDGFSIFVIRDTSQDIAALETLDVCRHDLLSAILRSVFGVRFDTGLSGGGDFRTVLTGHSVFGYNRAFLVYEYDFELPMDLQEQDAADTTETVAFRDIDLTEDVYNQEMTVKIPLDDDPQNT